MTGQAAAVPTPDPLPRRLSYGRARGVARRGTRGELPLFRHASLAQLSRTLAGGREDRLAGTVAARGRVEVPCAEIHHRQPLEPKAWLRKRRAFTPPSWYN